MRKVPIDKLTPTMRLGKPVRKGTLTLINAGTTNLDHYVRRLQQLGISHLYIEDAACEGIEVQDPITDNTRMKCKKTLETTFTRLRSNFSVDVNEVTDITESVLSEILGRPNMLVSLNEIGDMEDNTLDHSVNTTIFAICVARELGYDKSQMLDLAQGTLLHDIGKTSLDSNILFKPGKLTPEEFDHVKQHTLLGYGILSKNSRLSESSKRISLCHHERLDGSGYPNHLVGEEMSEYARIAAIVDVYEALTVDRCYHKAIAPSTAMEILMQEANSKLDFRLTSIFLKNIAVYPNGTMVLLSNGSYGIVKEQNHSMPLRPVVRTVEMKNGTAIPKDEIDLLNTLNITITECNVSMPGA